MLLFASLAEECGQRVLVLRGAPLPATVGDLRARLSSEWPALRTRPYRVAVNQGYASDATAIGSADELALIPPVSGG